MTIYILFLCFKINGECQPMSGVSGPTPYATLRECEDAKKPYTQTFSLTRPTEAVDEDGFNRRGMKLVCMKKTVPTWEPAE
jgi:hypothetical protein